MQAHDTNSRTNKVAVAARPYTPLAKPRAVMIGVRAGERVMISDRVTVRNGASNLISAYAMKS